MGRYEVLELQPSRIELRLIKPSAIGSISRLGRQWIAEGEGLNGVRGFQRGVYHRLLGEEGSFSLTFPNVAGDDGVLHRRRFAKLTDPEYAPGDEWIEIYRVIPGSRTGDLLFVGTITDAGKGPGTIEVSGFDAFWMQKKQRETNAGSWVHGPRDVFEHYASRWTVVEGENFAEVPALTRSTTLSVTPDARFKYQRVSSDPVDRPGQVLLEPIDGRARWMVGQPVTIGQDQPPVRFEARVRPTVVGSTAGTFGIALSSDTGSISWTWMAIATASATGGDWTATGDWPGGQPVTGKYPIQANQEVHFAIEIRGKYMFWYLDGTLIKVARTGTPAALADPYAAYMEVFCDAGTAGSTLEEMTTVAVEEILIRRVEPHLIGTDKGDYRLPGVLPATGLWGEYFRDHEKRPNPFVDTTYLRQVLLPGSEPYAQRAEPIINFPASNLHASAVPDWQPEAVNISGSVANHWWSARFTGAIYLDLATYDYTIRCHADDRVRIYIGKTGKTAADVYLADWTPAVAGVVTGGSLRTHLGTVSGWYPIVIEYSQMDGNGFLLVEYNRSDQANLWVPIGATDYFHRVRNKNAAHLWGIRGNDGTYDHVASGQAPISTQAGGTVLHDATPMTGRVTGYRFAAAGRLSSAAHTMPSAQTVSVEGWITAAQNQNNRTWLDRAGNMRMYTAHGTGQLSWQTVHGGVAHNMNGPVADLNRRYHVVGTFNNGTKRLYINGVLAVEATGLAAMDNPSTPTHIGDFSTLGAAAWDGRIGVVAIYPSALLAEDVEELWLAGQQDADTHVRLSPFGVYKNHVRNESFYDQLTALMETFGYQATLEPRQLESPEFPGVLIPRVRVGWDTDLVINERNEAVRSSIQSRLSATDRADLLVLDAAGLGDPEGNSQLTVEHFNFDALRKHTYLIAESDSMSDITDPVLARQRAASLQALRATVWEEVGVQPRGRQQLVDSFPLTGTLREFDWTPGLGVRLDLPAIDVVDLTPRQMVGIERAFVPHGFGQASASWRQRPRGLRRTLERLRKATYAQIRNFQGQYVTYDGSLGSNNGSNSYVPAISTDAYTRIDLPTDLTQIIKAELVVLVKADQTDYPLYVNNANTGILVNRPGSYDITSYAKRQDTGVNSHQMYARVEGTGTGTTVFKLRLTVRV